MSVATIYGGDSFSALVRVVNEETNRALDLSVGSPTIAATAKAAGSSIQATSAVISNATCGEILVFFAIGTFTGLSGVYDLHVRVTIGTELQTVSNEQFTVIKALVPAAGAGIGAMIIGSTFTVG